MQLYFYSLNGKLSLENKIETWEEDVTFDGSMFEKISGKFRYMNASKISKEKIGEFFWTTTQNKKGAGVEHFFIYLLEDNYEAAMQRFIDYYQDSYGSHIYMAGEAQVNISLIKRFVRENRNRKIGWEG